MHRADLNYTSKFREKSLHLCVMNISTGDWIRQTIFANPCLPERARPSAPTIMCLRACNEKSGLV